MSCDKLIANEFNGSLSRTNTRSKYGHINRNILEPLIKAGKTLEEMASHLGVSMKVVKNRCYKYQLRPAGMQVRKHKIKFLAGTICRSFWADVKVRMKAIGGSLTPLQAWEKFVEQLGKCPWSGLNLTFPSSCGGWKTHLHTASVDRICSFLEYVKSNIVWVHKIINNMKGQLSDAEFELWILKVCLHLFSKTGLPIERMGEWATERYGALNESIGGKKNV